MLSRSHCRAKAPAAAACGQGIPQCAQDVPTIWQPLRVVPLLVAMVVEATQAKRGSETRFGFLRATVDTQLQRDQDTVLF